MVWSHRYDNDPTTQKIIIFEGHMLALWQFMCRFSYLKYWRKTSYFIWLLAHMIDSTTISVTCIVYWAQVIIWIFSHHITWRWTSTRPKHRFLAPKQWHHWPGIRIFYSQSWSAGCKLVKDWCWGYYCVWPEWANRHSTYIQYSKYIILVQSTWQRTFKPNYFTASCTSCNFLLLATMLGHDMH